MKTISVFFRYDDFSELSAAAVDARLIDAFRRHRVPCTFAVIPAVTAGSFRDADGRQSHPLSATKLALLKQGVADGAVDVALHGLHHRTEYKQPPHSEFAGVAETEQLRRVREGKRLLEAALDARISVFVPPWNTYDQRTLAALRAEGIFGISANRYSAVIADAAIKYLPITIETRDLRRAVDAARRSADAAVAIGVLLHPYDFKESGDERGAMTLDEFERELGWVVSQPDVQVASVSHLMQESAQLDAARFRANQPSVLENIFPPLITRTENTPLYRSARAATRSKWLRGTATAAFFVVLTAVSYLGGRWIAGIVDSVLGAGWMSSALHYAPLVVLAVLVARAIKVRSIYFRGMALVSALAGAAVALVVA